jgi:hypothetical protein
MISFSHKGDFSKAMRYLERVKQAAGLSILDKYGQEGVAALASATPVESGKTASSWYYEIERSGDSATITFLNSHVNKGVPIAIILQYGHGTGTGGWVQGRDYINPAIQPVFDRIADEAWKEVTRL